MAYVHKSGAAKRRKMKDESVKLNTALGKISKISDIFLRTGDTQPKFKEQFNEDTHSAECALASTSSSSSDCTDSAAVSSSRKPASVTDLVTDTTISGDSGEAGNVDVTNEQFPNPTSRNHDEGHSLSGNEADAKLISEFELLEVDHSPDLALWRYKVTEQMRLYWSQRGSEHCQNSNANFTSSRSEDGDRQARFCSKNLFTLNHPLTEERITRSWMCYSLSTGRLFCFHCKLFSTELGSSFTTGGFNDWKNASARLMAHERSGAHISAIGKMNNLKNDKARIDAGLLVQYNTECAYWRAVLERVVEVIKFLAERGLPFRGDDELIGSGFNGNYLGILELISKFDPFMAAHMEKHRVRQEDMSGQSGPQGRGSTSYLSSTICNEFITIIGKKVLHIIIDEVKRAKYYAVSMDSTPDASKVDRCTIIFRYMPINGAVPIERFVKFLDMEGHTAQQLAEMLLTFLEEQGIDINNCRGQSYDNASNMAGKYHSVQVLVRKCNPLAVYIPCFGHSLNLVGTEVVNKVPQATAFFGFIQNLYTFLSASTHRWAIMKHHLGGNLVLKTLSQTRWSARADATKALLCGYNEIIHALEEIEQDENEKAETRREADGLIKKMERLENGILLVLWSAVLERFKKTSLALQNATLDLNIAVEMLQSLKYYVMTLRDQFVAMENSGAVKCGNTEYKDTTARKRQRSTRITRFEGPAAETQLSASERFRTEVFLPIIDSLSAALVKRLDAYKSVCKLFGFLHAMHKLPAEEIRKSAAELVSFYKGDLQSSLGEELVHFSEFLKTNISTTTKLGSEELIELNMYNIVSQTGIRETFPNVEIALRIYLSLFVTNCSGERSFSTLKRVKNYLRTTMGDERLNTLSLLSIESDLMRSIDFKDIIADFAAMKARKENVN